MHVATCVLAVCMQPLPEQVVTRLCEWEFHADTVEIKCGVEENQHDTLVTLLSQLSELRVKDGVVMLRDWGWEHHAMAQVRCV